MKNTKNTLLRLVLGFSLLFVGVQSAFALNKTCGEGTIYFQAPSTWTAAYAAAGGKFVAFTKSSTGWWTLSSSLVGQDQDTSFFISSVSNDYCQSAGVTSLEWDQKACTQSAGIHCSTTGDLYIYENPAQAGKTVSSENPPNSKYFFVMIPPDMKDWMSAVPMLSLDGGLTGKALTTDDSRCGWYYYVFFDETPTDNAVLYRDDDTERADMIGLEGNEGTMDASNKRVATAIPLASVFSITDTLFFVPDVALRSADDEDGGFYYSSKDVEGMKGECTYDLAAIIYDTDAQLNPLFSCYATGAAVGNDGCMNFEGLLGVSKTVAHNAIYNCIGVHTGMVQDTLDSSLPQTKKKPKLSAAGKTCFISDEVFNTLFNYTEGVNEKSCYNMPFTRSEDGKWEFDSDTHVSTGVSVPGGFYPAETTTDASILADDPTQTPLKAARTKRDAEGAIFYGPYLRENDPTEGMPRIDILCNGPGWSGGIDCNADHLFADGDATDAAIKDVYPEATCVIGWSCPNLAPSTWTFYKAGTEIVSTANDAQPRWNATRNQHYCFESHAKFTYKPGLKFNFRGDDDIWVFIDNKLAVDLGGTHLAAPGYVKLDNFTGKSGKLVSGSEYDLDIFFCDRRTTMSNVRIKTNMYIRQSSEVTFTRGKSAKDPTASSYEMCYTKTGSGSCASAMTDGNEEMHCCGQAIIDSCGGSIKYYLTYGADIDTTLADSNTHLLPNGVVSYGTIDLTDPSKPNVGTKATGLNPGRYFVWITVDGGKPTRFATFKISGELDVVYGNSLVVDSLNKTIGYYDFVNSSIGCGTDDSGNPTSTDCLVPIYISSVSENLDTKTSKEYPLVMDPDGVTGKKYTLSVTSGLNLLAANSTGGYDPVDPSVQRTIGASGVDTLFAWVPRVGMTSNTQTYKVQVSGRTNAANITFYLPMLMFVDTLYQEVDETTGKASWIFGNEVKGDDGTAATERLTGLEYNFFVIALKPLANGSYDFCSTCSFDFTFGTGNSNGISTTNKDDMKIVNGGAIFKVVSKIKYPFELGVPATIAIEGDNTNINADYTPVYFADPPCPIPSFVDIFDVDGAPTEFVMNLPEKYYSATTAYQDGIADMADIYYDRLMPQDSLPLAICITWDSSSAEKINPYEKGYTSSEQGTILCNALVERAEMSPTNCDQTATDVEGNVIVDSASGNPVVYCDQRIRLKGLKLSESVKTTGPGYVYSFSEYKDNKGNVVKKGFSPSEGGAAIIDRVGPIPLSATVVSQKDGSGNYTNIDRLTVLMSEAMSQPSTTTPFEFFLQSALTLDELDRYNTKIAGAPVVNKDTITVVYSTGDNVLTPHKDDYLRLTASKFTSGSEALWKDKSDISGDGKYDSLRTVVAAKNEKDNILDDLYHWNSPTSYDETIRTLTPWVEISGSAEHSIKDNSFAYSSYAKSDTAITIHAYSKNMSYDDVLAEEGGIPGHFVKADLLSSVSLLDAEQRNSLDLSKTYFYYDVSYYTNLGGYVASKSGKILCNDEAIFGGNCTKAGTNRNYYIGWNMRSDNGREVGTGAYIVKINSYIKLTYQGGSKKEAKQSETSVWGVKKSNDKVYVKAATAEE